MPKDKGLSRTQPSNVDHLPSQWNVAKNPQEKLKSLGSHIYISWEQKRYNTVHPIADQYAISTVRFVIIYFYLA
jgi:hypothetical protein